MLGKRKELPDSSDAEIEALVQRREEMRAQKQFSEADDMRDMLKKEHGVHIFDDQRLWRHDDGRVGVIVRDAGQPLLDNQIWAMLDSRAEARKAKDWGRGDSIRDKLTSLGVVVDDKSRMWRTQDGRSGRTDQVPPTNWAVDKMEGRKGGGAPRNAAMGGRAGPPAGMHLQQMGGLPMGGFGNYPMPNIMMEPIMEPMMPFMDSGLNPPPNHPAASMGAGGGGLSDVEKLIRRREGMRNARQFDQADSARKELEQMGVTVDDKKKMWSTADGRRGPIPSWTEIQQEEGYSKAQEVGGSRGYGKGGQGLGWPGHGMDAGYGQPPGIQGGQNGTMGGMGGGMSGMSGMGSMMPWDSLPANMMQPSPVPMPSSSTTRYEAGANSTSLEAGLLDRIRFREGLRQNKDWKAADSIRDELSGQGVIIDDKAKRWSTRDGRSGPIPMWE